MLSPLDEYPIHQTPLSMAAVATSDRNFYDRCYFNAHDRTGDVFLITGMGIYPNVGVVDGYLAVKRERRSAPCASPTRSATSGSGSGPIASR